MRQQDLHEQSEAVVRSAERPATIDRPHTSWYRRWGFWGACGAGLVGLSLFIIRGRRWATINVAKDKNEERMPRGQPAEEVRSRRPERYARELSRINDVLRNEVEQKTALLEAAAHDLKNPFFGIQALAEIVLENENLTPQSERKIRMVRDSAVEGLEVIDDLLRSAAEARKQGSDLTVLDVGSLVEWVVQGFEPHAERKGQHLSCQVDSASCFVEGNRRRLREAVSNLVSNALKYAPSNTRTDVAVRRNGDDVWITVTDEGPGLSERDQARMFVPFQRLSPKPTHGESASGLGLHLVKQIVEKHQGRVDVDSVLGEGSTFTIVLPAVSPPGGTTEKPQY